MNSVSSARPFRVILNLKSPYIPSNTTPTLDGVLWGALSRRLGQPASEAVPLDEIPLTRSHGVFHGSRAAIAEPLAAGNHTVSFFRSFFRERDQMPEFFFDTKTGWPENVKDGIAKVRTGDIARGIFKPAKNDYPLLYRSDFSRDPILLVVAFFGHGDPERVRTLLRFLPGIGRKVHQGYGLIESVRIDPIEQDYSLIRNGQPMRPIPVEGWTALGGDPALRPRPMRVMPPYLGSTDVMAIAPDDSLFLYVPKEAMR